MPHSVREARQAKIRNVSHMWLGLLSTIAYLMGINYIYIYNFGIITVFNFMGLTFPFLKLWSSMVVYMWITYDEQLKSTMILSLILNVLQVSNLFKLIRWLIF